jgi:DNA-binding CsgD family transcriptional regulator
VLLGRTKERDVLAGVLGAVRAGHSSALVVRGEAGTGKTSLLEQLEREATACRVLRVTGVQSEAELAFAGLHQLCTHVWSYVDRLPAPQRAALQVALGLAMDDAPEPFLVGLAALNLLSTGAGPEPLVCIVDDAQWIDGASMQALAFVARRLLAEPIGLVFGVRGVADRPELAGLPELVLHGLDDRDARRLLASTVHSRLDKQVEDRILAEAHGNPLALLELSRTATSTELAGGFDIPDKGQLQGRIELAYQRRRQALPRELQQLLLVAAAEPVGDVPLLHRALTVLGIAPEAAASAELEEFLEIGTRVRFVHPLVRSSIYRLAAPADRRAAHRALGEATDPQLDPDRRVWHLARAASGLDDGLAEELARSAGRARARGGLAASAAFLLRATELSSDPVRRASWALDAADAELAAGATGAVPELLATAELGPLDRLQQARVARLRAELDLTLRRGTEAPGLLLDSARRLAELDPDLCRETYVEAFGAAIYVGRLAGGEAGRAVAAAAADAPAARDPAQATDLLLDALVVHFTEGTLPAIPALHRAQRAFCASDTGEAGRGAWLATRVAAATWDDQAWDELTSRRMATARETGALSELPLANTYRAGVLVHAGEFNAAEALIEEAGAISAAIGSAPLAYTSLVLAAWRGQTAAVLEMVRAALPDAVSRGEGRMIALAEYANAVLHNSLGEYDEALAAAQWGCAYDDLGLSGWSLTELVEAAARAGRTEAAAAASRSLSERTRASGTDWALGIDARSTALVSHGAEAEDRYSEAIARLSRTRIRVHLARAHLIYGEWLRRENRARDARSELRVAHEMFRDMGAAAFAERAGRELRAAGDSASSYSQPTVHALTPQELQIAELARSGHTNPEIGDRLFISPRTVEWHLAKVFAKLDIRSRRELRSALPDLQHTAPV